MTIMTRARAIAGAMLGVLLTVPTARAQAQNAVITGRVTTEFGQPLEGANVYITELSVSVGSNAQGLYTITIPSARVSGQPVVLRTRSFGFIPQTKPITLRAGSQTADFSLKQDVNRLQEVVVTGVSAGTEQKKLPFTVAHVDDKDLQVPGADPLQAIQGKVPGATVAQTSGRAGSSPAILLRGPQSINASGRSQNPLFIVDGIVLTGNLPDLNPQDIESVEIVKGAAASSLYGSRAGNGVVQITTKNGRSSGEGMRFNVRTEFGAGDIEHGYPYAKDNFMTTTPDGQNFCLKQGGNSVVATCQVAINFALETKRVNELGGVFSIAPVNFERDGGIASALTPVLLRGLVSNQQWTQTYDPIAQATTTAPSMNHTVDATGRVNNTNFFASFNTMQQQNSIRFMDGYKRNSLRLNLDQSVGTDWSFGMRSYYAASVDNGAAEEDGGTLFFRITRSPAGVNLLGQDPVSGLAYIRSNPLQQGAQNDNPMYWAKNEISRNNNTRFLGDFTTKYTPFSWASIEGNMSIDRAQQLYLYEQDKGFRTTAVSSGTNNGFVRNNQTSNTAYNGDVTASANHAFGDLTTRLTGRYIYEQQDQWTTGASGGQLAAPGLVTLSAISDNTTIGLSSGTQSIRAIGMLSELNLEYKDRYILSGLVRRDGSSLFGAENRWADYGRASAAWVMSSEPWFKLNAIDQLKFRASYGSAGGRPSFAAQYETFSIGSGGALSANQLGNKLLRPETVKETELGIDAEVLNKYGLSVSYAVSNSYDQILPVPPSAATGFTTQWQNAGTLQNKTWEASLNLPLLRARNLSWTTRFNYDRNRAYITKLNEPPFAFGTTYQNAGNLFWAAEGERYANFYGREFVTSCSQLPAPFNTQCGGSGSQFQKDGNGYIVWTGGHSIAEGITNNLWQSGLVSCVKNGAAVNSRGILPCQASGGTVNAPWANSAGWGMPIVIRDSSGNGDTHRLLGNALPNFRLSNTQSIVYKRASVYGLFDGNFGRKVWNMGRQWSFGDFQLAETDQAGKSVADAKPLGYYWRVGPQENSGVGGLYDVLGPNNNTVEDASFVKLRELNVSYALGAIRHTGDWTVSLIGRNLKTWTKYTGFDPEVGFGGGTSGNAILNALDAYTFPPMRTFSFMLSTKF